MYEGLPRLCPPPTAKGWPWGRRGSRRRHTAPFGRETLLSSFSVLRMVLMPWARRASGRGAGKRTHGVWENVPARRAQQWTCSFCLSENFRKPFPFQRKTLRGQHYLARDPCPSESLQQKTRRGRVLPLLPGLPLADGPCLGGWQPRSKTKEQRCTLCFCCPAPGIPRGVPEVAKAGSERLKAAGGSRGNACGGAVAAGVTLLLPGSTTLLPREEAQNARAARSGIVRLPVG